MYALAKAGIPLLTALRGLSSSVRSKQLSEHLSQIADDLQSGLSLTACLQKHANIFDPISIAMVHVGENTGKLDEAFLQISRYLELERDTKKRIKQATRYPKMVVFGIMIAMGVINVFVIPAFAKQFEKMNTDLPVATKILMASSNFTINYWWLIIIMLVSSGLAIHQYIHTDKGLYQWDKYKLKIPLLGRIFERIALARFCRVFSSLYGSGIPILQSLSAVAQTVGNACIARAIRNMHEHIDRGEAFTQAAIHVNIFTPLVVQMIAVGEETGRVDEMLIQVAEFYEEEVDYDLKKLADSIEPILLLFMGAMVLVLALGIFLPMWELGSAMKK